MKRFVGTLGAALMLICAIDGSALALEYRIDGAPSPEYHDATAYEDVYGADYNCGGWNAVELDIPELPYGKLSAGAIGPMEKFRPLDMEAVSGGFVQVSFPEGISTSQAVEYTGFTPTAHTSVSGMEYSDGSIGTVSIPAIDVSLKVWEGETAASMGKGLAHYSSTSGWDGNVGVCGHNRGSRYVIGGIKDLAIGDTITYTTVYGTRTYSVITVATIASTDWSYLEATADNRITLTTCLANQPAYRVCVQAVEVT